ADAQAFLHGARGITIDGPRPAPSALEKAYSRSIEATPEPVDSDEGSAASVSGEQVAVVIEVIREAGVLAAQPRALLTAGEELPDLAWLDAHVAGHPESEAQL